MISCDFSGKVLNLLYISSTILYYCLLPLSPTFNRENSFHIPFPFLTLLFLIGLEECRKESSFSLGLYCPDEASAIAFHLLSPLALCSAGNEKKQQLANGLREQVRPMCLCLFIF